ncbi:DUF6444 domain-containing protein [Amycolatopsis sp. CA-230715]|uniref:DUF6444 domain-containing protein n=1 Tax=Amycolatopsis sp. CA-230715 TaxID=2745196 RepID=UPI0020B23717|nr:DUF6444 domain-containing protein [Amycolatopsis sp. CA-230715]
MIFVVGKGVRPSYDELAALVAAQKVELDRAREEITQLRREVASLKRRLGANSGNSSMPPSSDRFSKPAPKSLRGKTGRKRGKQPGAPGASLSLVDDPTMLSSMFRRRAVIAARGCATVTRLV